MDEDDDNCSNSLWQWKYFWKIIIFLFFRYYKTSHHINYFGYSNIGNYGRNGCSGEMDK